MQHIQKIGTQELLLVQHKRPALIGSVNNCGTIFASNEKRKSTFIEILRKDFLFF